MGRGISKATLLPNGTAKTITQVAAFPSVLLTLQWDICSSRGQIQALSPPTQTAIEFQTASGRKRDSQYPLTERAFYPRETKQANI